MESPQLVGAVAQVRLLAVKEVEIVTMITNVEVVLCVVKITADLIFHQLGVIGVQAQIAVSVNFFSHRMHKVNRKIRVDLYTNYF